MPSPEQTSEAEQVWLTGAEASELAHVSIRTLARAANAGKVEAFTTPGGHRRYSRSSILRAFSPAKPTVNRPIGQIVIRDHDDSDFPITGRVIGWEDEDRVLVLWGDDQYHDDPDRARTEYADQLVTTRRKLVS